LLAGRYRVDERLGRGGMGTVYRAFDLVLEEDVALKLLRPDVAAAPAMAARFRSEIKLARRVSHWNVCRIHEYGEEGTVRFISMELVRGETLGALLARRGRLPTAEALELAAQVADGLAAIHKVGIIHRDLKPANVMVDAEGTAKVMDFGVAKAADDSPDSSPSGYVLGSPEYMSPEQARGRAIDFRSDVYSAGILIFEMLTGRVPFRAPTPVETLMMHVEHPPPLDDAALPRPVVPLLERTLAKKAEDRFPDARTLATALRDLETRLVRSGEATPSPLPTVRTRQLRRAAAHRRLTAAILGGALALGAMATWMVWPSPGPPVPSPSPRSGSLVVPPGIYPSPAVEIVGDASPVPSATPSVVVSTSPVPPVTVARASVAPSAVASVAAPVPSPTPVETPIPLPSPVPVTTTPPVTAPPVTPPPTTVAAVGWLQLAVQPWANVTVDGRPAGQTPLRIPLAPGPHRVQMEHEDYEIYPQVVMISAGETTRLRVDLTQKGVRRQRR
jgi:serine/threonine-protein kinase